MTDNKFSMANFQSKHTKAKQSDVHPDGRPITEKD